MWLLTFSALCVRLFPRHVEDGVVQLKETDEDVEGLEEEAVCLTDVLILSISQKPVSLYNWQPLHWVQPWNKLRLEPLRARLPGSITLLSSHLPDESLFE